MNSNNQSFFIEEVSQYDIIDESYSIMYKDMRNWHNLQLAIYECVLNEGNIINFIKDIIHKIIETLKKWWKNITDFIKKVINNIKSKLSNSNTKAKILAKIDEKYLKDIPVSKELFALFKAPIPEDEDMLGEEIVMSAILTTMSPEDLEFIDNADEDPKKFEENINIAIDKVKNAQEKVPVHDTDAIISMMLDDDISKNDEYKMDMTSNNYITTKNNIEACFKLLEKTKKRSDDVQKQAADGLKKMENGILMKYRNPTPENDKLIREFMIQFTTLINKYTNSVLGDMISSISQITTKASSELESVVDSLIKKNKEDK